MDPITQQTVTAAAGAGGDSVYVDDVFSTYLYDGTGAAQSINNGIDLAGEGGLTWIKVRSDAGNSALTDTERGANKILYSDAANAEVTGTWGVNAFNSNGFNITGGDGLNNSPSRTYASWSFRKAPGFFDVVTYNGSSSAQNIAHNLGSVPGFVIVKRLDSVTTWRCWHRSLPSADNVIHLNETGAYETNPAIWNSTAPTSTHFTVGTNSNVNTSGSTYVAYIFAHDDAQFGTGGDESIIKCGQYTGSSSAIDIDLGWEPQWFLVKRSDGGSCNWLIFDNMRGVSTGGDDVPLSPNLNSEEGGTGLYGLDNSGGNNVISFTANGVTISPANIIPMNVNGDEFIYMAIRRPHKPPEVGTDVFSVISRSGSGSITTVNSNMGPVDMWLTKSTGDTTANVLGTRMLGPNTLTTSSTAAENTNVFGTSNPWDVQEGVNLTSDGDTNASFRTYINYFFKRTPGFMDVVAYTGTGSARTVNHNLGVVPELMIIKRRDNNYEGWAVYVDGISPAKMLELNTSNQAQSLTGRWDNTAPTNNNFTVETHETVNIANGDYIAYLFATLPGISKVGSYTGTGNTIHVDCGFTNGARFILIKRTDGTGDWFVFDTARGIINGLDPYIRLNLTNEQVTTSDFIDPLSSGFTLAGAGHVNTNGESYIFLAIA